MNVEIITIGDELLIGQVVDTNSAWMGKELNRLGFEVVRKITIGDEKQELLDAFDAALSRVDIVLVTGGIGPTKDDITKKTLCEYFDTELVFNDEVLANIEALFAHRNIPINPLTRDQAFVPKDCTVIPNKTGTAPITWFERDGKVLVSMPGVPYEMKAVMTNEILPRLNQKFNNGDHILHRTFSVKGYTESGLALHIADWENALPSAFRLAYLPSPGIIRLRITARGKDNSWLENELIAAEHSLFQLLGDAIYQTNDLPMGEFIGELLKGKGWMLATAESCTGGYIAHQITATAGSSLYFKGSVVAYANEIKANILGVNPKDIEQYGAVSETVCRQMLEGITQITGAEVAIATTGIAGPDGGSIEKPVGTIWIGVKVKEQIRVEHFRFGAVREANIQRASSQALLIAAEMINSSSI